MLLDGLHDLAAQCHQEQALWLKIQTIFARLLGPPCKDGCSLARSPTPGSRPKDQSEPSSTPRCCGSLVKATALPRCLPISGFKRCGRVFGSLGQRVPRAFKINFVSVPGACHFRRSDDALSSLFQRLQSACISLSSCLTLAVDCRYLVFFFFQPLRRLPTGEVSSRC